ncbi:MAG TPA: hypothetical protein GX696_01765 [Pseudomonadaceae bacterium]|nr:hypothetical protein [Pseudomonadaceae bacterium]
MTYIRPLAARGSDPDGVQGTCGGAARTAGNLVLAGGSGAHFAGHRAGDAVVVVAGSQCRILGATGYPVGTCRAAGPGSGCRAGGVQLEVDSGTEWRRDHHASPGRDDARTQRHRQVCAWQGRWRRGQGRLVGQAERGYDALEYCSHIELRPRYDYFRFIGLVKGAEYVITDGGSNQEECFYLGKPCLLMRKATERDEGVGDWI